MHLETIQPAPLNYFKPVDVQPDKPVALPKEEKKRTPIKDIIKNPDLKIPFIYLDKNHCLYGNKIIEMESKDGGITWAMRIGGGYNDKVDLE